MNDFIKSLFKSILAGLSISLGCMIYLCTTNAVVGALFFTTGLFLVLTRGYNLYTGKIAYFFDVDKKGKFEIISIWFGNLIGSLLFSTFFRFTAKYDTVLEKINNINSSKLSQGHLSAFLLAIFCGLIIFFAVENFKTNPHEIGKYLGMILLIPLFILCGFEHCVANMFYFTLTNDLIFEKIVYTIIITLGNSTGSIIANSIKNHLMSQKK